MFTFKNLRNRALFYILWNLRIGVRSYIAEPKRIKIYLFTRPSVGQIATKEIPQVFVVSSAVEMLLFILTSIMGKRETGQCSFIRLC